MKHLLTVLALLAVVFSFNSHAYLAEGRVVNQGPALECIIDNYTNFNVSVVNYWFEMTVRDNRGVVYPMTHNLPCVNYCLVSRNSAEVFLGAPIAYNVLAARCFANYVILN